MVEIGKEFLSSREQLESIQDFKKEALAKRVDIFKDELVIHGTFIENLKSILENGLGRAKSIRRQATKPPNAQRKEIW